MLTKFKQVRALAGVTTLIALLSTLSLSAQAQIDVQLAPDTLDATAGQTVTYTATLTNTTTDAVYINSDDITFGGPGTPDDTPFLLNFTGLLDAGQSITFQPFLNLTLDDTAAIGQYFGTFEVLGGSSEDANDLVGSVNFSVATTVPEPSSIVPLLMGMSLVGLLAHRRAKAR